MNTGYDHLVSRNRFQRNVPGNMEIENDYEYGYDELFRDLYFLENKTMYPLLKQTEFTGYLFYYLAIRKKDFTSHFLNLLQSIKPFPSNVQLAPRSWNTFIGDLYYFILEFCIPEQQLFPNLTFTDEYPNFTVPNPTIEILENYKNFMVKFLMEMDNASRDDEYMILDGDVDVAGESGNPPSTLHNILQYFPDKVPVFVIHEEIYDKTKTSDVKQEKVYINQKIQKIEHSKNDDFKFQIDKGYIVKTVIPLKGFYYRECFESVVDVLAKGPIYVMRNNNDRFITAGFKNQIELQNFANSVITKAATSLGFVSKYPS